MRARFLSRDEQQRLNAALEDAKRRTDARLALTVVRMSDKYALYPPLYGALFGLLVLTLTAVFMPGEPLWVGACAGVGGYLVAALLLEWLPLRLAVIPKRAKFWECWELAHRSFASRVLAQNERRFGILFFVSLAEHYVEVVTDRDVDLHIPQSVWDAIIRDFAVAAKQKRLGEGLTLAVEACTKALETHYPKVG